MSGPFRPLNPGEGKSEIGLPDNKTSQAKNSVAGRDSIHRSVSFGARLFYISLFVTVIGLSLRICTLLGELDVGAPSLEQLENGVTRFPDGVINCVLKFESALIKGSDATLWESDHWSPLCDQGLYYIPNVIQVTRVGMFPEAAWQPFRPTPNMGLARSPSRVSFSSERRAHSESLAPEIGGGAYVGRHQLPWPRRRAVILGRG